MSDDLLGSDPFRKRHFLEQPEMVSTKVRHLENTNWHYQGQLQYLSSCGGPGAELEVSAQLTSALLTPELVPEKIPGQTATLLVFPAPQVGTG